MNLGLVHVAKYPWPVVDAIIWVVSSSSMLDILFLCAETCSSERTPLRIGEWCISKKYHVPYSSMLLYSNDYFITKFSPKINRSRLSTEVTSQPYPIAGLRYRNPFSPFISIYKHPPLSLKLSHVFVDFFVVLLFFFLSLRIELT